MEKQELREYLNKDISALRALNFSEQYIKSTIENTSKWANTGLLGGISDPYIGRQAAILLENQRLWNEQWPVKGVSLLPEGAETDLPLDSWVAQWKRCSIPAIRRTLAEGFVGYNLVSVQSLKAGQGENVYAYGFDGRLHPFLMDSNSRRIPINYPGTPEDKSFSLQAEADLVANFSQELCNEFSREIIGDLAMGAGKLAVYQYKDEDNLLALIEGMSAYIGAKCYGKDANWIVTSPTIVHLLGEHIQTDLDLSAPRSGVNWIGMLAESWRIFEDSTAKPGNILLGFKDPLNHYFSGYVFSPYLPINPTPAWKTNSHESTGAVLSRCGKRLINPSFYGTLKIENLPEITPLSEADAESEE